MVRRLSFDEWLKSVDLWVASRIGMSYSDLPDCPYSDWYHDGVTPRAAASRAIRMADE